MNVVLIISEISIYGNNVRLQQYSDIAMILLNIIDKSIFIINENNVYRRYMAKILPIWPNTLPNQSINQRKWN